MNAYDQGIRKAAILVTALDRAAADRLLDQMSPVAARQVRRAVMELGDIDPGERRRVVDEFFRAEATPIQGSGPAVHLDAEKARSIRPPAGRTRPGGQQAATSPDAKPQGGPFGSVREVESEKLARILRAERPQTIALVLSHLTSEQAGQVLARLEPGLQVEVVRRLVDLEETDPDVLRDVEQVLEGRLARQIRMERPRAAGLTAVAGIVEAAGHPLGMKILNNLAAHEPRLAGQLGPERIGFEELGQLDDSALAAVLSATEPEVVRLALIGAPESLIDRLLGRLPDDLAAEVRRRLNQIGPTRLSDVEQSRRQIEELAWRLAATGHIQLPQHLCVSV